MSISNEELVKRFGGAVAPKSPTGPTNAELAKQFGGAVAPTSIQKSTAPPARGVDDPTHDMSAPQLGDTLSAEYMAKVLEPFSARGPSDASGHAPWKVPDIITSTLSTAGKLLFGGPKGQVEAGAGLVEAPIAPIRQLTSSDPRERVQGAAGFATQTIPAIEGVAKAGKAGVAATAEPRAYMADRLIASLLKPDKSAFDFGADPVQAVLDSGAKGNTLGGFKSALRGKLTETESLLKEATKVNDYKSRNIAEVIHASIEPEIQSALNDGRTAMVKSLERLRNARIARISQKYGTLDLNPSQYLEAKRDLGAEIRFTTDETQLGLNRAKTNIYRGMDQALDSMIPGAEKLNQHYSGLIEGDKLLDKQIADARKSDILPSHAMDVPKKLVPTAIKTNVAQAINPRKPSIPLDLQAPTPPRALIGKGPVITPPPADTSGLTVTQTPYAVPPKQLTSGASPIITPPPPESFAEALARTESPQSKLMREHGEGTYNKQGRPSTAEEYLRTKGGTRMPKSKGKRK